jgi:hypothetical protein
MGRHAALKKGGKPMQQPIRYYITKSGDEPTVRSVKVALNPTDAVERTELTAQAAPEVPRTERNGAEERRNVKRLVQGALRRRTPPA